MSTQNQKLDTCGCCEGLRTLTPALVKNLPGLAAIAYRVGTHAGFKVTMQSQLSTERSLHSLTTRDDNDHAIGLIDGWATVADVLTFYQERIANEGYLRTATEKRSILELARLIGYELNPGVAAGTYLTFTLETVQGGATSAKIGVGTKAQSVPGQDELPQVFETVEEIEARGAWNALKPALAMPQEIGFGTTKLYLKGTDTQLQPGDAILIVGDERDQKPRSERWDFRILQTVSTHEEKKYTIVTWVDSLGHYSTVAGQVIPRVEAAENPKVFAFRQRAALFGHNAPDWRSMTKEFKEDYDKPGTKKRQWPNFEKKEDRRIYLDAVYPKILDDSWIVLMRPSYYELYKAVEVVTDYRAEFTLTAKTTRIDTDTGYHLDWFRRRETVIFAQSEALEMANQPLDVPVFGYEIVLDQLIRGLVKGHTLIVTGKPLQRVVVAERKYVIRVDKKKIVKEKEKLFLISADESKPHGLEPGDVLEIVEPPLSLDEGRIKWHLQNKDGVSGFVTADRNDFFSVSVQKNDEPISPIDRTTEEDNTVSEVVMLDRVENEGSFSTLIFTTKLQNIYQRDTVTINANVARATHGETKVEVLGSGDGSLRFQEFVLKQNPLTFVAASTPKGAESTLKVRVNDVLWEEVPTFFGHGPDERIYITRTNDDGKTRVIFGDGRTGARLPTGQDNVRAEYRKGIGLSGLMKARQISQLMTRPLGIKEVVNPIAATGADDPEKRDQARQNAPFTVLTLDRIVSLQDFEDFARAFAGIGKAQATMLWNGEKRMVHITVSGVGGRPVKEGSELHKNFMEGINAARHTYHQVIVNSYELLKFNIKAMIHVDRSLVTEDVMDSVIQAIRTAFSFDMRNFGQAVTKSEMMAVIQRVLGVIALDLEDLYFSSDKAELRPFLPAHTARWDEQNINVKAAELLTVNTSGIILEEMKV